MAKIKKLEQAVKSKKSKIEPTVTAVETAKVWIKDKLKADVVNVEPNTYKVADGSEKKGHLLTLDNGRKFQAGEVRFWAIK